MTSWVELIYPCCFEMISKKLVKMPLIVVGPEEDLVAETVADQEEDLEVEIETALGVALEEDLVAEIEEDPEVETEAVGVLEVGENLVLDQVLDHKVEVGQ